MAFCLTKQTIQRFKKALKDREIDPMKLALMTSLERRAFLEKYVGKENAVQTNALFESKILLKNQKAGYISWAKKITGITPEVKRDLLSKIERLDKVLDPKEEEQFLGDLASTRLGVEITQEEAKTISALSKKMTELKTKIPETSGVRSKERIEYGTTNALLKEYIAKLKSDAKQISFREEPVRKILDFALNAIPNLSQSIMTAYDNSLWLRQMIGALTTPRYTKIWVKNFLKSWSDIGKELKGHDAMLPIKADVYSRPNALNGKYDADPNGYGLGVRSEEVYSSDWPAKIPILGRLFKASQSAFNGGALRMRADISDLEIKAAETIGINVLDKEQAGAIGSMVTSITGRGSVGGGESILRKIFWAPRMYVAQLNRLTIHLLDPKANVYTRKQSAKNLLSRLAVYTLIFTLAKMLDKDSVDEKENLGKIKIWGKWVDQTGGDASYINLAMKMTNKLVTYLQGQQPKYGERSAMDDLVAFAEGKFSPTAGVIRDILKGSLYNGKPITLGGLIRERFTPISSQTWEQLSNDPTASNVLGLILLEELGANVSSWLGSNEKTEIIPTNKKLTNKSFVELVSLYANALGTDPETAFNRIFTGQKILKVSGDAIIVERMSVGDSQAYKKKYGQNTKQVKLDHTIPLELGGDNSPSNLKIVSTSDWSSYTKVENALGKALKNKKISKNEARNEIKKFKSITDTKKRKSYGDNLIRKYQ